MKKELEYFYIEDSYGGNQEWFTDFMMNRGGCGALTACDTCLYLHLYQGKKTSLSLSGRRIEEGAVYSIWRTDETVLISSETGN